MTFPEYGTGLLPNGLLSANALKALEEGNDDLVAACIKHTREYVKRTMDEMFKSSVPGFQITRCEVEGNMLHVEGWIQPVIRDITLTLTINESRCQHGLRDSDCGPCCAAEMTSHLDIGDFRSAR